MTRFYMNYQIFKHRRLKNGVAIEPLGKKKRRLKGLKHRNGVAIETGVSPKTPQA